MTEPFARAGSGRPGKSKLTGSSQSKASRTLDHKVDDVYKRPDDDLWSTPMGTGCPAIEPHGVGA